jgi:hypothetical protein
VIYRYLAGEFHWGPEILGGLDVYQLLLLTQQAMKREVSAPPEPPPPEPRLTDSDYALLQQARDLIAACLEQSPPGAAPAPEAAPLAGEAPAPPDPPQPPDYDYVGLDQMAVLVQRSKSTLDKLKQRQDNPLPNPDVKGGGGKRDEWIWSRIRPWLEKEFGRHLPATLPRRR